MTSRAPSTVQYAPALTLRARLTYGTVRWRTTVPFGPQSWLKAERRVRDPVRQPHIFYSLRIRGIRS